MNKFLKLAVALMLLLAVVVVAQGGAWAAKINNADAAPVAGLSETGLAVSRPAGTSSGTSAKTVDGVGAVNQTSSVPGPHPDGTYYMVSSCSSAVTVQLETGPNWAGGVFYYDGGSWTRVAPYKDNGKWYVDLSCAADPFYFIVGPAGS